MRAHKNIPKKKRKLEAQNKNEYVKSRSVGEEERSKERVKDEVIKRGE